MVDVTCVQEETAPLGEGPLWVASENAVYWVDITGQKVHRVSLADGTSKTWSFDTRVTSLVEREQGGFACTIKDGYAYIDLDAGTIEPFELPEADVPANRFNDGKVDMHGRYWAGTMNEQERVATGTLYCIREDQSVHKMDDGYMICNGPTFNKEGTIMYHNDSTIGTMYAYDLNPAGEISNKRVFYKLPDGDGHPDGMTVDSENCIWLAHYGGARVTRFSPQAEILQVIPMPAPNVTSCTFGGENLDTLYITTARQGLNADMLSKYPLAGSFFSCKPGVIGLPTPRFKG